MVFPALPEPLVILAAQAQSDLKASPELLDTLAQPALLGPLVQWDPKAKLELQVLALLALLVPLVQ
jgi:hypothetical protein